MSARADLCGGRSEMIVPTATRHISVCGRWHGRRRILPIRERPNYWGLHFERCGMAATWSRTRDCGMKCSMCSIRDIDSRVGAAICGFRQRAAVGYRSYEAELVVRNEVVDRACR